jgi:hypothetical protein
VDDETSSEKLGFPDWQPQFHAALLEVDPKKLEECVRAAEAAIFLRQQALVQSPVGHAERQAIEDALRALRVIQKEKLNSSGRK